MSDTPNKDNYIQLDYKNKDSDGMPGIKINYRLSKNTKRMLSHGINQCKNLLKTAGAKKLLLLDQLRTLDGIWWVLRKWEQIKKIQ